MSDLIFEKDISTFTSQRFGQRDCYTELKNFMVNENLPTICALYGIRRSGKSVLMEQLSSELTAEGRECIYLMCKPGGTMSELEDVLLKAYMAGKRYAFIDEITELEDFQRRAASLSDIFAGQGMRIIIAGTDSLGISLAAGGPLLDRVHKIHTSYISYGEYKRLLDKGIDDYIAYGGTLTNAAYKEPKNEQEKEALLKDVLGYYNGAIVENILKSLEKNEGVRRYPPELTELYERDELTTFLQRIANAPSHTILAKAMRKEFSSSPLGKTISAMDYETRRKIILGEPHRVFFFEKCLDATSVNDCLRIEMGMKSNAEIKTTLSNTHLDQLKGYLVELGLLLQVETFDSLRPPVPAVPLDVIMQPGMVYAQVDKLLNQLKNNGAFLESVGLDDREEFVRRAERSAKGVILEDAILVNTFNNYARTGLYVSQLSLRLDNKNHEVDMIITDEVAHKSYVFEVKYSEDVHPDHLKHLTHDGFMEYIDKHFGVVNGKYLVYNGPSGVYKGVSHLNVDDFFGALYRNKDNWKAFLQEIEEVALQRGPLDVYVERSFEDKLQDAKDRSGPGGGFGGTGDPGKDDPGMD